MERGVCAQTDPDSFYPDRGESNKPSKKVCNECEVQPECLEYALENEEPFGVWGGLSERERRKIIRERKVAEKAAEASLGGAEVGIGEVA
jgi:WhiB family redox-sensing transcriptional regulator